MYTYMVAVKFVRVPMACYGGYWAKWVPRKDLESDVVSRQTARSNAKHLEFRRTKMEGTGHLSHTQRLVTK